MLDIKEIIANKSDIQNTESSFESKDCYLQIIDTTPADLPEDHYIRSFLENGDENLGQIHFLPFGLATATEERKSEILLTGLKDFGELVEELNKKPSRYDVIFGMSDPQMISVASAVGFKVHDLKAYPGSQIISAKPKDLIEGYKNLKERLTPNTMERLKERVLNN